MKYAAYKLEFLEWKWAIKYKFHEYLYGNTYEVYTDNNQLTYVLTSAKLDATGHRWVASLANNNFGIHYKSGKTNVDAGALSRIPCNSTLEHYSVQNITDLSPEGSEALTEVYRCNISLVAEIKRGLKPNNMSREDWVKA